MKNRIMYIEHKTDQSDRGEAWIGRVEFSKTGQTIYFNGQAFKKFNGQAFSYSDSANYFDIETGEGYWISGIKKNGQDRHWAGGGKIKVDKMIAEAYLELVNFNVLDEQNFELVDIIPTDKQKFAELENQKI